MGIKFFLTELSKKIYWGGNFAPPLHQNRVNVSFRRVARLRPVAQAWPEPGRSLAGVWPEPVEKLQKGYWLEPAMAGASSGRNYYEKLYSGGCQGFGQWLKLGRSWPELEKKIQATGRSLGTLLQFPGNFSAPALILNWDHALIKSWCKHKSAVAPFCYSKNFPEPHEGWKALLK